MTKRQKRTDLAGFSLIELLIVVVVIGILAAVGVPSYLRAREAAQKGATVSNLRTIHTCQTSFFSTNGRYARIGELNALCRIGTIAGPTLQQNGYVYITFPAVNPTNTALRNQYAIAATKYADGVIVSQFTIMQDGVINMVISGVPTPL